MPVNKDMSVTQITGLVYLAEPERLIIAQRNGAVEFELGPRSQRRTIRLIQK